jgi:hypothetical protein
VKCFNRFVLLLFHTYCVYCLKSVMLYKSQWVIILYVSFGRKQYVVKFRDWFGMQALQNFVRHRRRKSLGMLHTRILEKMNTLLILATNMFRGSHRVRWWHDFLNAESWYRRSLLFLYDPWNGRTNIIYMRWTRIAVFSRRYENNSVLLIPRYHRCSGWDSTVVSATIIYEHVSEVSSTRTCLSYVPFKNREHRTNRMRWFLARKHKFTTKAVRYGVVFANVFESMNTRRLILNAIQSILLALLSGTIVYIYIYIFFNPIHILVRVCACERFISNAIKYLHAHTAHTYTFTRWKQRRIYTSIYSIHTYHALLISNSSRAA